MTNTMIPTLSLAFLLVACAHDSASKQVQQAEDAQRTEGKRRSGDENAERVELPRKHDRGELASAHGVPGREQSEPEAAARAGQEHESEGAASVGEQGNGEIDLDLTQRIRKAVIADDSLSFTAKNVKIITRDGRVTLRGQVKTSAERDAIYQTALREAGAGHVTNALEVDAQ